MTQRAKDAGLMQQCLTLARKGGGWVTPNPMVGCVIVKDGRIVGEGYHRRFGGPHAEIFALRSAGSNARGGTLYVNLEPCSHYGKTPPCADSIIAAGVKEVVIASTDPNPLVRGRGIRKLKKAGVIVRTGVGREEADALNERFVKYMRTGVPFVGLKLAQTLDGRIADASGNSKWISSAASRTIVHRLRSEYDAVLVGADTARKDNPELTVRLVRGRQPVRVVLDGRLRTDPRLKIFDTSVAETIVVTTAGAVRKNRNRVAELARRGVKMIVAGDAEAVAPRRVIAGLGSIGIMSVLVEGGARTVQSFMERGVADRLHLFIAPSMLGEGLNGISFRNRKGMRGIRRLDGPEIRMLGTDVYITGRMEHT